MRTRTLIVAFAVVCVGVPHAARSVEPYNFGVAALAGAGASLEDEFSTGIEEIGYQLNLSMVTEPGTLVVLRVGRSALEVDDPGPLADADLSYATVSGEYRLLDEYYRSGIFVGLGGYRLDRELVGGAETDDTAFGLTFGVTGDFELTNRWSIFLEAAGHWADLEGADLFVTGHAGVAFRF